MALPRSRRTARRTVSAVSAGALVLALTATACTVQDRNAPSSGSTSDSASGSSTTGRAPGVTGDSIKVGIAYPDLASVRAFIDVDLGDYEATYKALIDKINARGGVQGRRLVPVFGKLDVLSAAAAQETCVKLTRDDQVFAVLGTFAGPEQVSCYTRTNRTAVIGGPQSRAVYAQAEAPWFSEQPGSDLAAEVVEVLARRGDLTGRKIAVVGGAQDQGSVEGALLPALRKAGVSPVATGYLQSFGVDAATLAQQTNVVLQKARSAGADTLLLTGTPAQTLPLVLEKTSWRPRLLFTDAPGGYQAASGKHDFGTLSGAVVATPDVVWSDPMLQECASTVEKADPRLAGKLVDPNTVPAGQPLPGVSLWTACLNLRLFTAIAGKAGTRLDYTTFQRAGLGLGAIHLPGYADDATYGPSSTSGSIPVKAKTYDPATNRFVPAAPTGS
ncbi:ABC transporter substrate-binding protein [Streptomyces sp. NPDC057027]|uniref:ABC transporter substrate-binding protein n=1 Tax=Streptomyces sp. NPDC057027 TaxID=3346004 RepID=UPI003625B473